MLFVVFTLVAQARRVQTKVLTAFREAPADPTEDVIPEVVNPEDVNGRLRSVGAIDATHAAVNGTAKVSDMAASLVASADPVRSSIGDLRRFPLCTERCCRCSATFANTNPGTVEVNVRDMAGGCNPASMQEYVVRNASIVAEPRAMVKEVKSDCVQSFAEYECDYECTHIGWWPGPKRSCTLFGTGAGDTMMQQAVYEQHVGCSSAVKSGSVSSPCKAV